MGDEAIHYYQHLFRLLGTVFLHEPTAAFLQSLKTGELFNVWPEERLSHNIERGIKLLKTYFFRWTPVEMEELRLDYTRLFIGLDHCCAPPVESVYLSRDHLMFEEQTRQLRQLYKEYGLEVAALHRIPDDHIGYQFLFISRLLTFLSEELHSSPKNHNKVYSALKTILNSHLSLWIKDFYDRVQTHSCTDFYRGMGELAVGGIEQLSAWTTLTS